MAGIKKTYTMSDMALEINKKLGVPYRDASAIATIMLERIKAALTRGQTVDFRKFGKFEVKKWGSLHRLRFTPAKSLKLLTNKGD